jgi:hypothetical protein
MNVGEKVRFPFAKKEMQGTVEKIFQKTIYIRADFPKQKNKMIKRKLKDVKA